MLKKFLAILCLFVAFCSFTVNDSGAQEIHTSYWATATLSNGAAMAKCSIYEGDKYVGKTDSKGWLFVSSATPGLTKFSASVKCSNGKVLTGNTWVVLFPKQNTVRIKLKGYCY